MGWAAATLRLHPSEPWLDAFLTHTQRSVSRLTPQGLANVGWALASLEVQPPSAWLLSYEQAVGQALAPGGFSGQGLTTSLWALAKLGRRPGEVWLAQFLAAAAAKLPSCNGHDCATLLWALAHMQVGGASSGCRAAAEGGGLCAAQLRPTKQLMPA